jgi:hypothetical protein
MRRVEACIESHGRHFEHLYECTLSAVTHKLNVSRHMLMWTFLLVLVCAVLYRHHEDCTCIFNYTCQSLPENTVATKITDKLTVDGQGLSSHECRYEFVQCTDFMFINGLVRKSNPGQ